MKLFRSQDLTLDKNIGSIICTYFVEWLNEGNFCLCITLFNSRSYEVVWLEVCVCYLIARSPVSSAGPPVWRCSLWELGQGRSSGGESRSEGPQPCGTCVVQRKGRNWGSLVQWAPCWPLWFPRTPPHSLDAGTVSLSSPRYLKRKRNSCQSSVWFFSHKTGSMSQQWKGN